ncbi:MAG: hypothetical protein R2857_14830 [Vampirovibrionales bacterium]
MGQLDLGQFRWPSESGPLQTLNTTPGLERRRMRVQPNKTFRFTYDTPAGTHWQLQGMWADNNGNGQYDDGDVLRLLQTRGDFDPESTTHYQFSDGNYTAQAKGSLVPEGIIDPEAADATGPNPSSSGPPTIIFGPMGPIMVAPPPPVVPPGTNQPDASQPTDPNTSQPDANQPTEPAPPTDPDGQPAPNRRTAQIAAMHALLQELGQLPESAMSLEATMPAPFWSLIADPDKDGKTTVLTYDENAHAFTAHHDVAVDSLYMDGSQLKRRIEGERDPAVYIPFVTKSELMPNGIEAEGFDLQAIIGNEAQYQDLVRSLLGPKLEDMKQTGQTFITAGLFKDLPSRNEMLAQLIYMHRKNQNPSAFMLAAFDQSTDQTPGGTPENTTDHDDLPDGIPRMPAPRTPWQGPEPAEMQTIRQTIAQLQERGIENFEALEQLASDGQLSQDEARLLTDIRRVRTRFGQSLAAGFLEKAAQNPRHYFMVSNGERIVLPAHIVQKLVAKELQGLLNPIEEM